MKIKVVDNFLPAIAFEKLSTSILSYDFPWYYTDKIVYDGDNEFQYFHRFYDTFDGKSNQYQLLTDTLNCIDGYKLRRAKANSTTKKIETPSKISASWFCLKDGKAIKKHSKTRQIMP